MYLGTKYENEIPSYFNSSCNNEGEISLIYFSSIVKQVFTTYLNNSRVRFLEPTSTGVI